MVSDLVKREQNMKTFVIFGLLLLHVASGSIRVTRGIGYGGGGGGGSGGGGAAHVLLSPGGGYGSAGAAAHTLNVGSGPAFHSHTSPQQAWYYHAAIAAGDPYAAKAIAQGQQTIDQADSAAASAAAGVFAAANDPGIANEAAYASHIANEALYNSAATRGAAAVYTGTARVH